MLTLLIVIVVLIVIACIVIIVKCKDDDICFGFGVFGVLNLIALIIMIIAEISVLSNCRQNDYIGDSIQMYTQENTKIESQIDTIVQNYMQYENKTLTKIAPKSGIQLITMYPNLKSDALVQSEMKMYTDNNNKIKELKQQQIDGRMCKWWLYFG